MEVDVVTLAAEFPNDNPALHGGVIWVCLDPIGAPTAEGPRAPVRDEAVAIVEPVAHLEPIASVASAVGHEEIARALEAALGIERDAVEAEVEDPDPIPPARPSGIVPIGQGRDEAPEHAPEHAADEEIAAELASVVHDAEADDDEPIVVCELEPLGDVEVVQVEAAPAPPPEPDPAPEESATVLPAPEDPFMLLCRALADIATASGALNVAAALEPLLVEGRVEGALGDEATGALAAGGIACGDRVTDAFASITAAWCAILRGTSDDLSACGAAMLDEWAADLLARMMGAPARTPTLRRELRDRGVAAFGLAFAA